MTFVRIVVGDLDLVLGLFILGWINAIRASGVRDRKLDRLIRPAMDSVQGNHPSALELVTGLAEVAATRNHLFRRLTEIGRVDIFPAAFRSAEKVCSFRYGIDPGNRYPVRSEERKCIPFPLSY